MSKVITIMTVAIALLFAWGWASAEKRRLSLLEDNVKLLRENVYLMERKSELLDELITCNKRLLGEPAPEKFQGEPVGNWGARRKEVEK